jgi:hypothetical protein
VWRAGRIALKLHDERHFHELLSMTGSETWSPGKVSMSKWVMVPESFHDDDESLAQWIRVAHKETPTEKKDSKVSKPKRVSKTKTKTTLTGKKKVKK